MKDKVDLPKMPWAVWVPMLELYALAALCVGYAVYLTSPLTAISEGFLLFLALIFFWFGHGLQRGREDVAELLVAWAVICGVLGALLLFQFSTNWHVACFVSALTLPMLLICLPSSRRWFMEMRGVRSKGKSSFRWLAIVGRVLAWVVFIPIALVVLIALLEIPWFNTVSRLVKYEHKAALITNEAEQVTKTFDFTQDGTNYTAIVLKPIGALPSGPAVFVADSTGRIIDRCRDYGDNSRFNGRWAFSWKDFRKEEAKTEATK